MLIGVPAESFAGETRVAVTPETAKKLKAQGHTLRIQSGAGVAASVTDAAYEAAGAEITDEAGAWSCDLLLKVRAPSAAEMGKVKPGAALVGMLNPFDADGLQRLAQAQLTSFALEAAPRTTRAQSMDVLSSQANIAGYKAVMIAADRYQRFFPMLMTAAGTVKAARVVKSRWSHSVPSSSTCPTRPQRKKKPLKVSGAMPARCRRVGSNVRKPRWPSAWLRPMW